MAVSTSLHGPDLPSASIFLFCHALIIQKLSSFSSATANIPAPHILLASMPRAFSSHLPQCCCRDCFQHVPFLLFPPVAMVSNILDDLSSKEYLPSRPYFTGLPAPYSFQHFSCLPSAAATLLDFPPSLPYQMVGHGATRFQPIS